jgi:hypothetical protein
MFGNPDELTAQDVSQALAIEDGASATAAAQPIFERLECPQPPPDGWFWDRVHGPWKARELSSESVRALLEEHLEATRGFYSRVAPRLGVRKADYQRFLDFLKHSGLKVDHRPFRAPAQD